MTDIHESHTEFSPTGRIHLGVSLIGPPSELDFEQLRTHAQTAERGLFSMLSLDERYWLRDDPGAASATDPAGSNDAATMLAAIAAVTFWSLNLTSSSAAPLTALIASYSSPEGLFWAKLSAASFMAIAPIVVFGWFSQKQLVQGLTFGAVK